MGDENFHKVKATGTHQDTTFSSVVIKQTPDRHSAQCYHCYWTKLTEDTVTRYWSLNRPCRIGTLDHTLQRESFTTWHLQLWHTAKTNLHQSISPIYYTLAWRQEVHLWFCRFCCNASSLHCFHTFICIPTYTGLFSLPVQVLYLPVELIALTIAI